jgi:RNA polymerase sigma factor (sigma-70 family)
MDDNSLIKEYLKGDEGSLEILIKRHLKSVYGFVYGRIGNSQEAEDITQEVFVRAWKNLKKFDRQKNFKSWIFAIAKNASIDFLRKKKTIPFSAFEDEEGNNFVTDKLIDKNIFPENELAYAVEKLPPKYRDVVSMHNDKLFTFKEISKTLGESINTVKSRYRRALINLKRIIK